MDRERPGWYQSSEEPDSDARAGQTPEAHGERDKGEDSQRREPSWRRRDKYDPFERLRRRRAQAEAERAERAEQAERAERVERAERAEAQRRSPSGSAPAGNPFADQPLAGPWGDGSAQETIAGDYPVIANDPDKNDEAGEK
ncbi:MAG: hypothetical protein ACTHZ5_09980 [Micrococcaceae bacterium]